MHVSVLGLLALLYLLAFYFGCRFIISSRAASLSALRGSLFFAIAVHVVFLVAEMVFRSSSGEWGVSTTGLMTSLIVALVAWALSLKKKALGLSIFALPFVSAGLLILHFRSFPEAPIDLPSSWIWTHISLMILGEVFFFFAALVGALYLISSRQLKRKANLKLVFNLPPLNQQQFLFFRLLVLGFCFLSFGILLGWFFAGQLWKGEWYYNATILLALLSWLTYLVLILLHLFRPQSRGQMSSWLVIGAFVILFVFSIVSQAWESRPHYYWPAEKENANETFESLEK